MKHIVTPLLVSLALFAASASAQDIMPLDETSARWNAPVAPFRIGENLYYVGASDIASYLVVTPEGLILIDGGFAQTAPQIVANLRTLGFDIANVRIILTSHAHTDHVGGVAELKRLSGARLLVSQADAPLVESGGRGDPAFGDRFRFPPARVDGFVADGQVIELGGVRLTANLTPGHTKGCTSWSMRAHVAGADRAVLLVCSLAAPGYRLVGNTAYPEIVADYRRSFDRLEAMPCEVPLAAHGWAIGLPDKMRRLAAGETGAMVDPEGCRALIRDARTAFEAQLARQTAAQ